MMERESGGRFRKRPVEVDAFQWTNQDRNDWPEWAAEDDRLEDTCAVLIGAAVVGLKVWTAEGAIRASHGDWIIKGIAGELYPCKPDIFAQTYDAVPAARKAMNRVEGVDERVERAALAIYERHGKSTPWDMLHEQHKTLWRGDAQAALASLEADEPTAAQIEAGAKALVTFAPAWEMLSEDARQRLRSDARRVFLAMTKGGGNVG
jgi:hypothetical protein